MLPKKKKKNNVIDEKKVVCRMKKWIIAICIVVALILLVPFPARLKDGGTVHYDAILYDVYDVHCISIEEGKDFDEGIIVDIFGIEIFNNVK